MLMMYDYINLEIFENGKNQFLRMTLNEEGKAFIQKAIEEKGENVIDTDAFLYDLLEQPLCNGWEEVRPEEIGALTSAPIISDTAQRNEDGQIEKCDDVYAFMDYAIISVPRRMLEDGHADWVYSEVESK